VDGKLVTTLRGDGIVAEFIAMLNDYVERRYGAAATASPAR
jgi:(E)-4-hydroxy-3-methylbut-2-enyl-diphosphate synthase